MASRYWAVSLPVQGPSASSLWNRLQDQISYHSFDTPLYRFNIPNLRVGTLDSLLALSDDLLKSNSFVEAVSHKIRRHIEELENVSGGESTALTVDGVPVDSYLTRFAWDEAKYPTMSPLTEIVDTIQGQVTKIEDDLKIRVAEYNNVRSQLNAINRKQSGSLAVRDLSNLVKPEDIVVSENLITLLAIVPKYSQKDWLSSYETLTNYVVPRCSKKLYEDNEYALYTVALFRRAADNFRTSARERGFQIRDFEYSPEAQEGRKQELGKLMRDQENIRSSLLQWCYASYGEEDDSCCGSVLLDERWLELRDHFLFKASDFHQLVCGLLSVKVINGDPFSEETVFSSWMHFCAVRVFVESILRYGLPPSFLACVLAPSTKGERKVRSILEGLCDIASSLYWRSYDDVGGMAGLGGDAETHPYVSFTVNLA